MLGELLRRLLWIPPTVVAVTLLTFALLASPASRAEDAASGPSFAHLPRFVNLEPEDLRVRAADALGELTRAESPEASAELSRLGGAALPYVIPELEAMAPGPRGRVVVALRPVGDRMGVGAPPAADDLAPETSFWLRVWEDRSLDFHPVAIRRAVRRYAEHPSPARLEEVRALDTAALGELFSLVGREGPLPDPAMARLVLPRIAHALGRDSRAPDGPRALAAWLTDLRAYWFARRLDFVALDGGGRAQATILETQYAKWAALALTGNLGQAHDGRPVVQILLDRGRATGLILAAGLSFGYLLALLSACLSVWLGSPRLDRASRLAFCLAAASPALLVAALGGRLGLGAWASGAAAVAAAVALLASRLLRKTLLDALDAPHVTTLRAAGASPLRVVLRELAPRGLTLFFTLAAIELPVALSAAFVAEKLARLGGLGDAAAEAVAARDVSMLMALAVAGTLVTSVAASLGDLAQTSSDARLREGQRDDEP